MAAPRPPRSRRPWKPPRTRPARPPIRLRPTAGRAGQAGDAARRGTGGGRGGLGAGRGDGRPAAPSRRMPRSPWRSSDRPAPSTAISPRTSPSSSPARCGWRRPRSRPRSRTRSPRRSRQAPAGRSREATVAGPGFVNLRLADAGHRGPPRFGSSEPAAWGRAAAPGSGRKVNVEFVSANPTGPLDRRQRARRVRRRSPLPCPRGRRPGGHARVLLQRLGDAGPEARRVGDRDPRRPGGAGGRLPRRLRRGARARACRPSSSAREPPPATDEAAEWAVGRWASQRIRAGIEASLERLGVDFDVWTTEGSLQANGWVDRAIARLREGGHLYEADGATWFRSTAFGDDKDRVVVRSDGSLTYFAFDIGYVTEKFSRGFDHLIYIWGVDHHGTVARNRERRGGDGLPARARRDAPRRLGPLRPGRRRGLDVEAGRHVHHPRRAAGRDRARRGPLVLRQPRRERQHRLRHRARQEAVEREPRLLRPVRPRPDRLDPAQGGRGRPGGGAVAARARSPAARRPRSPGSSPATRRSSRTRPRPRRPRA